MTKYYAIDHDRLAPYLYNSERWTCDSEPVIHVCRNAHDKHGCPGWKISAFCDECEQSHSYFITRHEALANHIAEEHVDDEPTDH